MRISDWSSDVCSSDLHRQGSRFAHGQSSRYWRTSPTGLKPAASKCRDCSSSAKMVVLPHWMTGTSSSFAHATYPRRRRVARLRRRHGGAITNSRSVDTRSEEHTSELQSLMRNSDAVFCLKKKTTLNTNSQ